MPYRPGISKQYCRCMEPLIRRARGKKECVQCEKELDPTPSPEMQRALRKAFGTVKVPRTKGRGQ